jgi:hypothetical protein
MKHTKDPNSFKPTTSIEKRAKTNKRMKKDYA